MEGISSIGDSLDWEADAIKHQMAMDVATINGTEPPSFDSQDAEADMRKTLIAGDYQVNIYKGVQPTTSQTNSSEPTAKPDTAEPTTQPVTESGVPIGATLTTEAARAEQKPKLTKEQLAKYIAKVCTKVVQQQLAALVPSGATNVATGANTGQVGQPVVTPPQPATASTAALHGATGGNMAATTPLSQQPWYRRYGAAIALGTGLLLGGGTGVVVSQSQETQPGSQVQPTGTNTNSTDTDTRYKFKLSSEQGKGLSSE